MAYVDVDMVVSSNLWNEAQALNTTLPAPEAPGGTTKVAWVLPVFLVRWGKAGRGRRGGAEGAVF